NIANTSVAVITNIELDHTEILGNSRIEIAREKAGIVKPDSVLILGETDPELMGIFENAAHANGAQLWRKGENFDCESNIMAANGRQLDLRVGDEVYSEVFLPLHGAHQGENAVMALAAACAFFGSDGAAGALSYDVVQEGLLQVEVPARLEVISRKPLVIIDGAHNPAGAHCAGAAVDEEFAMAQRRILITGMLKGRDPVSMLEAFGSSSIDIVIACPAPSPRSISVGEIVSAAEALGIESMSTNSVADAVAIGIGIAEPEDLILIAGSMYVAGAARTELLRLPYRLAG
ncbi:MAG TPA: cyanophycin synthetase, partial [Acidimicrobiales bacterium]|nr:cyanophycin synthetase [Acidimicrobiales bacterium]